VIKAIPLSALDLRVPNNCVIERKVDDFVSKKSSIKDIPSPLSKMYSIEELRVALHANIFDTITSPNIEEKYDVPRKSLGNYKNRLVKQLFDLNPNVQNISTKTVS
jgi:hypothetical protein